MATNVEIEKNKNENNMSILRRFTRKVQESGVLPKVRSVRYTKRTMSPGTRKNKKLIAIERKNKIEELIKLGKISQIQTRKRGR